MLKSELKALGWLAASEKKCETKREGRGGSGRKLRKRANHAKISIKVSGKAEGKKGSAGKSSGGPKGKGAPSSSSELFSFTSWGGARNVETEAGEGEKKKKKGRKELGRPQNRRKLTAKR